MAETERGHDPKLVEALKTLKAKLEAMPEPLRGSFIVVGLAPYIPASPKPPHQEEGAAGLAERLSDWRARGVSGEDADAAASALLSQASQIEALRKERDEARLCQQQIAAGSNQSATVARIIIAKNEADGRAEAAETKLAEALALLHKVFDGGTSLERSSPLWIRARNFLDANGDGHAQ